MDPSTANYIEFSLLLVSLLVIFSAARHIAIYGRNSATNWGGNLRRLPTVAIPLPSITSAGQQHPLFGDFVGTMGISDFSPA